VAGVEVGLEGPLGSPVLALVKQFQARPVRFVVSFEYEGGLGGEEKWAEE
jgi:hypothetical protein